MDSRISIIIPTLNEAATLEATVACVPRDSSVEIIVADGGSDSATRRIAHRTADRVVDAPRGRARQLNAGAKVATGRILLFLHADTRLPHGGVDAIRRALRSSTVVGGAFQLRIDSDSAAFRLIAWGANLRSRCLGLPYGDQALFVRANVFRAMGGFRDLPIMEDSDFVRRLRRRGRVALLSIAVHTSARRWAANGVLRTTLVNWLTALLFSAGVDPACLQRQYRRLLGDGKSRSPAPTEASSSSQPIQIEQEGSHAHKPV